MEILWQIQILQPKPTVAAGAQLTVSGLNIPAGGNALLVYETKPTEYAPMAEESEITNTATISGGGITPVNVKESIQALSEPVLTITKSVSPVPVTENGTLTYTFLVQNNGNTAAAAGTAAVITDDFDPILKNLTVSFNGTAWTEGVDYTYDETTGSFVTIAGNVTVPAAEYAQNPVTGIWITNPGISTLIVTGTV
ncbi:hypothetical protein [Eubacterium ramulus]|uniref:hypothetical protein n=1 Tax=Eubacterium ramulus TaxID=39490 RepID=UPI0039999791